MIILVVIKKMKKSSPDLFITSAHNFEPKQSPFFKQYSSLLNLISKKNYAHVNFWQSS